MNTSLLNDFMLNSQNPPAILASPVSDLLQFDGYGLQNNNVITTDLEIDSSPKRSIFSYKVPRNDGSRLNGVYYQDRIIRLRGVLQQSSASALTTMIDTFKRRMGKIEGNFDQIVNGETRRIAATLQNTGEIFKDRKGYHINYTPFVLEFLATDPFFHDLDYTSIVSDDVTINTFPISIENLGTAYARPVVTLIFQTATSVTSITFTNTTNGKVMVITRAFAAGDILVINSETSTVTVNGVAVDYDGVFPTLEYGTNDCTIVAAASALLYVPTISFKQSYL